MSNSTPDSTPLNQQTGSTPSPGGAANPSSKTASAPAPKPQPVAAREEDEKKFQVELDNGGQGQKEKPKGAKESAKDKAGAKEPVKDEAGTNEAKASDNSFAGNMLAAQQELQSMVLEGTKLAVGAIKGKSSAKPSSSKGQPADEKQKDDSVANDENDQVSASDGMAADSLATGASPLTPPAVSPMQALAAAAVSSGYDAAASKSQGQDATVSTPQQAPTPTLGQSAE